MSWVSSEVVGVLTFLLPGFLAAKIFYSLTFHPVPGVFDRIIHALIFTVAGRALTASLSSFFLGDSTIDESAGWNNGYDLLSNFVVATILAVASAFIVNNDTLHGCLRRINVTKETSYTSEWYRAFARHPGCYVILHMDEQRCLYGYPEEWLSDPNKGHFRITEAEWLADDVADANRLDGTEVAAILVPATQVKMVEFLNMETVEKPKE